MAPKFKNGKPLFKNGRPAFCCCNETLCPTPFLECDSISASGSKEAPPTPCGYFHDGQYWAIKTETQSGSVSIPDYDGPGTSFSGSRTEVRVWTKAVIDGECVESGPAISGSSTLNELTGSGWSSDCTSTLNPDGSWTGTLIETSPGGVVTSTPYGIACWGGFLPTVTSYTSEVTPEEGESTGDLIARVTDDLPAYPDTWSGGCSAARDLSPDESSFSISKFRWRVTHDTIGEYLKVWLRKVTTLEGEEPEFEDLTPYEWVGPGEGGEVSGPENEETISEDGTVTIEIVKWTCVEGFEPPDP